MVATATIKRNGAATFGATIASLFSRFATFLKYGIAALPIYPAARINWDAGIAQNDITLALVGIGFAVGGAICIENAVHSLGGRRIASASLWGSVGLILLLLSFMNALGNFAGHSDHSRDVRSSQQSAAETTSSQRSQLEKGRNDNVAIIAKPFKSPMLQDVDIPGEASVTFIETKIEEYKATGARYWKFTQECAQAHITTKDEREFCSGYSELDAKKKAAVERDRLTGEIAKIDNAPKKVAEQSNVISFADSIADAIVLLGYDLKDKDGKDDKAKLLISRIYDWGRALGVEILAFFLPSGILQLFVRGGHQNVPAPQVQPQAQRKPERPSKATVAPIVAETLENLPATIPAIVATSQKEAEIDAFRASCLEENIPAAKARSTPVFEAWKQYCAGHGIEAGSQKAFCDRIQARGVRYDRNNGRPIYLNVRLKPAESRSQGRAEHGPLRLAVNNAA
jgi:hypothetical protein